MEPRARRQAGAHYTGERDILRVIEPLFLTALRAERVAAEQTGEAALRGLLLRLRGLRFLDPACGCGDFLVVTLRALRELELAVLLALRGLGVGEEPARVGRGQMVGIEIDAVAAGIARDALAQVDAELDAAALGLGLPVVVGDGAARIHVGNALCMEWKDCLPAEECAYVLGNPPFVGKKEQSPQQKADMARVWQGVRGAGVLDLASCWFRRAAVYIAGTAARVGFVATSSIAQGEQVAALWGELLAMPDLHLQLAVRSFVWGGAAGGRAEVHVVVIGFGCRPGAQRLIVEHAEAGEAGATVTAVREISPYLVAGGPTIVRPRRRPIAAVPELVYGSFALDGGHYTLDVAQRAALLEECPEAAGYVRSFVGGRELLRGEPRYCLWLQGAVMAELERLPAVMRRVAAVAAWRAGRGRALTRSLAATPTRFAEVRQPEGAYLAIPTTSSERRRYLPIGFLGSEVIASNQLYVMPGATSYEFGVLQSAMHIAWVRQVCGRLKSDLRYSNAIVYNNFPWPVAEDEARDAVVGAAAEVLAARAQAGATLAVMYAAGRMPEALVAAHARLDAAVDRCYGAGRQDGDRARVELLFARYEQAEAGRPLGRVTGACGSELRGCAR